MWAIIICVDFETKNALPYTLSVPTHFGEIMHYLFFNRSYIKNNFDLVKFSSSPPWTLFSVSLQTWSQRVQPNISCYSEAALTVQLSIMQLRGTNQRRVTGQSDSFLLNPYKRELLPAHSGNAESSNKLGGKCWGWKWASEWFFPSKENGLEGRVKT